MRFPVFARVLTVLAISTVCFAQVPSFPYRTWSTNYDLLKEALALTDFQYAALLQLRRGTPDRARANPNAMSNQALSLLNEEQRLRLTALEAAARLEVEAGEAGRIGLISTGLPFQCFCDVQFKTLQKALELTNDQMRRLRGAADEAHLPAAREIAQKQKQLDDLFNAGSTDYNLIGRVQFAIMSLNKLLQDKSPVRDFPLVCPERFLVLLFNN